MIIDPKEVLDRVRHGDRRLLARTISMIENRDSSATEILKNAFAFTGNAVIVGITGAPGAGKSSLVDRLTNHLRKESHTVAVVAVDPSSPFSGGAILGDRVRMQHHSGDEGTFIRSMATRGHLGGLAGTTADVVTLLDAAGYDYIIVETVGVGQDEVDIIKTAHISIVVLVPGMGDDIQAIKAGIMEIGDIFVINKADRNGVLKVEQEVKAILSMNRRDDGWNPPILKTVAIKEEGIVELLLAIKDCVNFLQKHHGFGRYTIRSTKEKLLQMAKDRLFEQFLAVTDFDNALEGNAKKILDKTIDPYSIIENFICTFVKKGESACRKK